MSLDYIEQERIQDSPQICVLTINRPAEKNALNSQVVQQLTQLIETLEQEASTRVVILRGKQENFAAGADIKEMLHADVAAIDRISAQVHELHRRMNISPMIFITAIEGYCLGGGFELALASDIRIASPTAVFGLPEVKLGILPGGWGTQKFQSLASNSFATKYILTGDFFDAEKALSFGLISSVVNDPFQESLKTAEKIASHSFNAVQAIKRLLTGVEYSNLEERFELERNAFKQLFIEGEAREGLLAFTEKRKPNFKGV
ncbi:enoyl-CoA hydratase/isomerase family protein [Sporosarcina sp. 179-K 3D1 HS]|uniref:enoyl-CoA hydratase/isomerase family protein n=1 Tax=Sporosarcina sp. 179-K 3D1 HS TaxID=3232169 RepID=UPI0039A2D8D1